MAELKDSTFLSLLQVVSAKEENWGIPITNSGGKEEKLVLKEYGDAYLKYKESTPMFFPIKLPTRIKEIAKQT